MLTPIRKQFFVNRLIRRLPRLRRHQEVIGRVHDRKRFLTGSPQRFWTAGSDSEAPGVRALTAEIMSDTARL